MTSTSEQLLAELPLFAGIDIGGLTQLLTEVSFPAGHQLWRQEEPADALYIILEGRIEIAARLPRERIMRVATLGPRDVLGEFALLDGGTRSAGALTLESVRLLMLAGADFQSVLRSRNPGARSLRRRLTLLACSRLHERQSTLAMSLPGDLERLTSVRGERADPPAPEFLLRLPFLRGFTAVELHRLLGASSVERVGRGALLVAEGEPPPALFVTLEGAVEEVIVREDRSIRVGLSGPGRGFGYACLLTREPASAAAVARERAVVLVVAPAEVERQLERGPFADALERDVVLALRHAQRPHARLAAGDGSVAPR